MRNVCFRYMFGFRWLRPYFIRPPELALKGGYIVVVVLTLTHRYNAVRGHRTGSNNSGAEDYLRRKTNKNRRTRTIAETNRIIPPLYRSCNFH